MCNVIAVIKTYILFANRLKTRMKIYYEFYQEYSYYLLQPAGILLINEIVPLNTKKTLSIIFCLIGSWSFPSY